MPGNNGPGRNKYNGGGAWKCNEETEKNTVEHNQYRMFDIVMCMQYDGVQNSRPGMGNLWGNETAAIDFKVCAESIFKH